MKHTQSDEAIRQQPQPSKDNDRNKGAEGDRKQPDAKSNQSSAHNQGMGNQGTGHGNTNPGKK